MEKKHPEYQYLDLLKDIKENGSDKQVFFTPEVLKDYEIKGVLPPFIRSVFGRQIRFNLNEGFPLLTTKRTFARGIIVELLWFLSGSSNIKYLVDNNIGIWNQWAYKAYAKDYVKTKGDGYLMLSEEDFISHLKELPEDDEFVLKYGDLKSIYGRSWRRFPASDGREIDQLAYCIDGLRNKPYRKSYVVSAWCPEMIYGMSTEPVEVPPFCHTMFQFAVLDGKLNLQLYQRSADTFLGVPFNIASYALLLEMVAQVVDIPVGEFVHSFGDVHIYSDHFDQVDEQLKREPMTFPKLVLNKDIKEIDDFKFEDITIEDYKCHKGIKAECANVGGK